VHLYAYYLAAETGGFDVATLSQYGVLGIFAIIMVTVIRTMYKRELDRADAALAEVKELHAKLDAKNKDVEDRLVPALVNVTNSMESAADLLVEMHAFVREHIRGDSRPAGAARIRPTQGGADA
jgi:hypothetical protein